VTDDRDNLLAECRELATAHVRDVLPISVYVVFTSEGAPEPGDDALGQTGRAADVLLRPHIEAMGQWQGRAWCIHLDDLAMLEWVRAASSELNEIESGNLFRQLISGVTAHEIGHIVELGPAIANLPESALQDTRAAAAAVGALAAYSAGIHEQRGTVPWRLHDGRFLRAVFHTRFRLLQIQRANLSDMSLMLDTEFYGLSSPRPYWQALMGELKERINDPIFEAATAGKPPKPFRDLWRADVHRFQADHPYMTDNARVECQRALTLWS
jgi:hypothetical protein